MSTRCRIGLMNEDGSITSIYCHHDGYPKGVGNILVNNYTDIDKIKTLLCLGDMSSLGTEPIDNPFAWKTVELKDLFSGKYIEKYKEYHPDNMCDTYKTRGQDCPAKVSKDIKSYLKLSRDWGGEYTYVFKDNEWFVMDYNNPKLLRCSELCID